MPEFEYIDPFRLQYEGPAPEPLVLGPLYIVEDHINEEDPVLPGSLSRNYEFPLRTRWRSTTAQASLYEDLQARNGRVFNGLSWDHVIEHENWPTGYTAGFQFRHLLNTPYPNYNWNGAPASVLLDGPRWDTPRELELWFLPRRIASNMGSSDPRTLSYIGLLLGEVAGFERWQANTVRSTVMLTARWNGVVTGGVMGVEFALVHRRFDVNFNWTEGGIQGTLASTTGYDVFPMPLLSDLDTDDLLSFYRMRVTFGYSYTAPEGFKISAELYRGETPIATLATSVEMLSGGYNFISPATTLGMSDFYMGFGTSHWGFRHTNVSTPSGIIGYVYADDNTALTVEELPFIRQFRYKGDYRTALDMVSSNGSGIELPTSTSYGERELGNTLHIPFITKDLGNNRTQVSENNIAVFLIKNSENPLELESPDITIGTGENAGYCVLNLELSEEEFEAGAWYTVRVHQKTSGYWAGAGEIDLTDKIVQLATFRIKGA